MFDKFVPDIYEKSIYTIDYKKLKKRGIKCLIFDLDNTIAPTNLKKPNKKLKDLFEKLDNMEFKIILFSNSPRTRLEPFKKELNIDCCAKAGKPRKNKFLKISNKLKNI